MVQKLINASEKITWNYVFLFVLAMAGFFYFTLDTSEFDTKADALQAAQQQVLVMEKKVQEAREFEKVYDRKKKQYAEIVRQLQDSQGALPKQFYLPDLLSDLLKEAKQLELEITAIQPDQKETTGELYNSLGFTIEASGTFLQFFIFLDRLANMKRLVSVVDFNVASESAKANISLGGENGAFAAANLTGGKTKYAGLKGKLKVVTYRYRGGPVAGGG